MHARFHVVYVSGTQVIILNEPEYQSYIKVILTLIWVTPYVRSLEDCNHIVPNQRSVSELFHPQMRNFT